MGIVTLLLFLVSLLAVMGAGVMPAALPLVAVLSCSVCLAAGIAPYAGGPDRRLVLLASALVLFLTLTALPLPEFTRAGRT